MAAAANTQTSATHVDAYKETNKEEPGLQQKVEDLSKFISGCKFGMMTTRIRDSGLLVSRCMSLAAQECGGVDLIFHTNTESGKTHDLEGDPHANIAFYNSSGEWASISGTCTIVTERDVVKKYYNPILKAWLGDLGDGVHDGGEDDPRIGVIRVAATTATYAISVGNPISRGIEVVQGVITGSVPKVNKLREIHEEEIKKWRAEHA